MYFVLDRAMYLFLSVEQNEERRDFIFVKDYLPNYINLKVSEWFLSVYTNNRFLDFCDDVMT